MQNRYSRLNRARCMCWGLAALFTFPTQQWAGEIRPAADAPQPLPPAESLKRFNLEAGFRIELVAAEPLLADPVGMTFDERGRLFVCEIHGYNLDGHYDVQALNKTGLLDKKVQRISATKEALAHAEQETFGTVKLLEDTNGDGRMDRVAVWADRLPACYGLVPARGGVIVLCAPDIVFLGDRDGDGRAEVRETLFTGFGVGELWTRINHPVWGLDNWIYAACGAGSAGTITGPRLSRPVQLGNTGFRFTPDGTRLEPVSGGTGGFGLTFSDWSDRFLVSNQQHALHVAPLPYADLARNPYAAAPDTVVNISSYGYPAKVFPTAPPDPWRLARSQQPEWVKFYGANETTMGLVTAACSPLVYRGGQFPPEYQGNHFSCECAYNLIHRCVLEPDGAGFRAKRSREQAEFLTSSEQWFRPVDLALGPDGALYIVDMYREIIEDYTAIPRYLQQQYGLIAGHDRGRIWRVTYGAGPRQPAPDLAGSSTPELVQALSSRNGWRRDTAQRLLVERHDTNAVPPLEKLLRHEAFAPARLHALYTLAGLDALAPAHLQVILQAPHPALRRHAVQLAGPWLPQRGALFHQIPALVDDPDAGVRLQVALVLGNAPGPEKLKPLAELAIKHGQDRWMPAAILSSVPEHAGQLLRLLCSQASLEGAGRSLVRPLAVVVGKRRQTEELGSIVEFLAAMEPANLALRTHLLAGLIEGLGRARSLATSPGARSALGVLLKDSAPPVRELALKLANCFAFAQTPEMVAAYEAAAAAALNAERTGAERQQALALLASAPFKTLAPVAGRLLDPREPLDLQLAAVAAISAANDPGATGKLLAGWNQYSPTLQTAVIDAIFRDQSRLSALLDAVAQGELPRQSIDSLRRSQLLAYPEPGIRRRAEALFSQPASRPDLEATMARYQAALSGPRDARRGQRLFEEHCLRCHTLNGQGAHIGPDLGGTKGRADETLLVDLLQPSAQITAGYRSYTVVTRGGEIFTGILASETATSLIMPGEDGRPQAILRQDIEAVQMSELSLMPENWPELLQPQDVAGLLAYLREALAGPAPVLTLFDDDRSFPESLREGGGTAVMDWEAPFSGSGALRVTPPQRFSANLPGWNYRIVEQPAPGEYRYLRFAWKAPQATGVMLELAAAGQWPPADKPVRRFYSGKNTTGWQARCLADTPPQQWTEVTVDLWQIFGAFTLTGLAPTAMGGPAWFDKIQLLR